MDKYEYKVRVDAIKEMAGRGEYHEAAKIADSIDWRKCKSSMMLCSISDLYKVTKRYKEAKKLLLLAYEMRQGGKTVCYSLCEVCMKMGDYEQALGFYREFVQNAPKDPARLILQYKLYEMNGASLEDRIFILQELKEEDYREKWGYELAFLYHKAGEITLCIQECDELVLWFGAGKYVYKALELKQLHEPLTSAQQAIWDGRAEAEGTKVYDRKAVEEAVAADGSAQEEPAAEDRPEETTEPEVTETVTASEPEEMEIQVTQIDISPYSTINLQKEIAEGLKAVMDQPSEVRSVMEEEDTARVDLDGIGGLTGAEAVAYQEQDTEAAEESIQISDSVGQEPLRELILSEENPVEKISSEELDMEEVVRSVDNFSPEQVVTELTNSALEREERLRSAQPPREMAGSLSQESDGQIRLVMPGNEAVEKQITGQLSIEDVLKEWEKLQKERELQQKEMVERLVSEHTGSLFAEFEREQLDGLLERIENDSTDRTDSDEQHESEDLIAYEALPREDYGEVEELAEIEETVAEPEETEAETEEAEISEELTAAEETEAGQEDESMTEEPEGVIGEESAQTEEAFTEDAKKEVADETLADAEASLDQEPEDTPDEKEEDNPVTENPAKTAETDLGKRSAAESFKSRSMTEEEKAMYEPFIQSRTGRDRLIHAIDAISMAPYTGNIIVTGDASMDTLALAKTMIREVQQNDTNFSGRVAKITGRGLNNKDIPETFEKVKNGALIIQSACEMTEETVWKLYKALQQDRIGIIVALEDTRKNINEMLRRYPDLIALFNARVDMEPPSNDSLVAYAKAYARSREYSIDEFGILQLHNRIEQLQTIDHHVSTVDVRELVDDAIESANCKSLKHFFDILFGRRYDDEDMIILTEEDFEE